MEMFESDEDHGSGVQRQVNSMKKAAREHKREKSEREKASNTRSIQDDDIRRETKKRHRVVASNATGDSSLFGEEIAFAYAPKKKRGNDEERLKSAYNFRGFDPQKDNQKKGK